MGVDLRLLPFDADLNNNYYSHTVLDCQRRWELWNEINKLEQYPVPDNFTSFSAYLDCGHTGYGITIETPYGMRLKYVLVQHLCKLKDYPGVIDNFKNRAIWAYLKELPLQTKVALYWY